MCVSACDWGIAREHVMQSVGVDIKWYAVVIFKNAKQIQISGWITDPNKNPFTNNQIFIIHIVHLCIYTHRTNRISAFLSTYTHSKCECELIR